MTEIALNRSDDLNAADLNALVEPSPAARRPGQLVRVDVDAPGTRDGFDTFEVRITNRERLHYEKTAAKHKEWPDKSQNHAMTFVTWSAAVRAGLTKLTFPQWEEALLDWDLLGDEVPADPTQPAA